MEGLGAFAQGTFSSRSLTSGRPFLSQALCWNALIMNLHPFRIKPFVGCLASLGKLNGFILIMGMLAACRDSERLSRVDAPADLTLAAATDTAGYPSEVIQWEKKLEPIHAAIEGFWDALNQQPDPWAVLQTVGIKNWYHGSWSPFRVLDHGVHIRRMGEPKVEKGASHWELLLHTGREEEWQIEATQWRHVAFSTATSDRWPMSKIAFECFAKSPKRLKRYIIRGFLRVGWNMHEEPLRPETVYLEQVEWVEREGITPFEYVMAADVSPSVEARVLEPNLQVVDLDGDQLPEMVLSRVNQIFWNAGQGRFRRGALSSFLPGNLQHGLFAEFSGDAHMDYMAMSGEGLFLFEGHGTPGFPSPPRKQAIFNDLAENPFVLSAGDIDGDSDLDLWMGQYKVPYQGGQMPTPFDDANDGYPAFLMINDGRGVFSDQTSASGLSSKAFRRTYSGSLVDLDRDRDLDLVVVSDFAGMDVYENDGFGRFVDRTLPWLGVSKGFGMGHLIRDLNRDGLLDLWMIGMHSPAADRMLSCPMWNVATEPMRQRIQRMNHGNRLFLGDRKGGFEWTSGMALDRTGWSWGCSAFDADLDGDQDLYVVNGHITGPTVADYESEFWREDAWIGDSQDHVGRDQLFQDKQDSFRRAGASFGGHERNRFFLNQGAEGWLEVAYLFGLALSQDCRNVVAADLDLNGRPDLCVISFELWPNERQALHLFPNFLETDHHWLGLSLDEGQGPESFMGCVVELRLPGETVPQVVVSGDGYRTQSPYQLLFGLGELSEVEEVLVAWPSGATLRLKHPEVDRYHRLNQHVGSSGEY